MKLRKRKLIRHVEHHSKRHIIKRPYLVPLLGIVVGFLIVIGVLASHGGENLKPSENHVVFLNDGGKHRILDTKAKNVGELIAKLNLKLITEDVVEPALDTEILEDNFRINVYRARPVAVIDQESRTVALTAQRSARMVAENAGIEVYPEDVVTFGQGSLRDNIIGEKVVIERAIPVQLDLFGRKVTIRTQAKTVEELLLDRQIELTKEITAYPQPSTPVSKNLKIFIVSRSSKVKTVEEEVPAPVESVSDSRLTRGTTAVRQAGKPGRQVVTYQIEIKNGKEVKRRVLEKVVTVKPVPRIVAVGAAAYSYSLEQWLYKLRVCESGGNYKINTGNGYYGAYQFSAPTWNSLNTGYARADLAPPAVQDRAIIANTLRASGGLASQNPGCYHSQGLSQFPPSNR